MFRQVMHTETVLPISPSPAFHAAARTRPEKMVADVTPRGEDGDAAVTGDDDPPGTTPALLSPGAAVTKTLGVVVASAEGRAEEGSNVPAAAAAVAAEVATGCSGSSGGGGGENDGRRRASFQLSSPAAAGTEGTSGQPVSDHVNSRSPRQHQPPHFWQQEQRSVGSRAWEGVRTAVEMASGAGAGQDRWSDTEDPTDSESGSDSETDNDSDDGRGPRTAEDTTHVRRGDGDTAPRSSPRAGRRQQQQQGTDGSVAHGGADPAGVAEAVATTGLGDENRGGGGSGGAPGVIPGPTPTAASPPKAWSPTPIDSPPAVPTSPFAPVAKLRGGGADGGGGDEVDCDPDGEDKTMAGQDEEGGSGDGGGGVDEGEVKGEEDEEREESVIQWEFVNGFLHEVSSRDGMRPRYVYALMLSYVAPWRMLSARGK